MASPSLTHETCWQALRARPREHTPAVIAGIAGGLTIFAAVSWFFAAVSPGAPATIDPPAVTFDGPHSFTVLVHYKVPVVAGCTKHSTYLAYQPGFAPDPHRDIAGDDPHYMVLASALGGGGLKASADRFWLRLDSPRKVESGTWHYILRVEYSCWPGGTIHWRYTTDPVTIRVP